MKKKDLFLAGMAIIVMASCGRPQIKMGDNEYPVETISLQSADFQATYPAIIQGINDVEIRPKVSGNLTRTLIKEGQRVTAGQVLFVIDDVQYKAQVTTAEAALSSAKAQLATAKLSYDNALELNSQGITGEFSLSSAKNTYESAQAAVAQAQASLTSAKDALSYCYVKAPSAGYVGDLPYDNGALVSSSISTPLTTVSDDATMKVYFSMTEKEILSMSKSTGGISQAIKEMPAVKLQLADGTIYSHEGKISAASGIIDATTGSIQIRVIFSNPEHLLKSGGSGSIIIPSDDKNAIVIPQSCTTDIQNKTFVYTVGSDNKVKYTEITTRPQNDGVYYVVTSGLKVGDKIVLKGMSALSDDMEITPITIEQYNKKIEEAEKLGAQQTSVKSYLNALSK